MLGCIGRIIFWSGVVFFAMLVVVFTLGGGELTDANIELLALPAVFIGIIAFGLIVVGSMFS